MGEIACGIFPRGSPGNGRRMLLEFFHSMSAAAKLPEASQGRPRATIVLLMVGKARFMAFSWPF
jgi:hypothetical protein